MFYDHSKDKLSDQERLKRQILQEKQINDTLGTVNNRLHLVESALDKSLNAICISDLKGVLYYYNRTFADMYQYGYSEMLGQIPDYLGNPGEKKLMNQLLIKDHYEGEIKINPDGENRVLLLRATRFDDRFRGEPAIIRIYIDITHRKKTENLYAMMHETQTYLLEPGDWQDKADFLSSVISKSIKGSYISIWQYQPSHFCKADCALSELCEHRADCLFKITEGGESDLLSFNNGDRIPDFFIKDLMKEYQYAYFSKNDFSDQKDLLGLIQWDSGLDINLAVFRFNDRNNRNLGLLICGFSEILDKEEKTFLKTMAGLCSQSLQNALALEELEQSREEALLLAEKAEKARLTVLDYSQTIERDLKEKSRMLEKAHILQKNLIQTRLPSLDNQKINALYMPSESLGGDFFCILKGKSVNKLVIVIGDCTGHGIKSSIDASLLSTITRRFTGQLFEDNRTDHFIEAVSKEYRKNAEEDTFPTMLAAVIDLDSLQCFYSNANHPLPYYLRADQVFSLPQPPGIHMNVGYFDSPSYGVASFQFQEADRLFFYSDAVFEVGREIDEKISNKNLEKLLAELNTLHKSSFDGVIEYLEQEHGSLPLEDDTTFVEVQFLGFVKKSYHCFSINEWNRVLIEIRELLIQRNSDVNVIEEFSIALEELAINALFHGNKEDSTKRVKIEVHFECNRLSCSIEDEGSGFDYENLTDPASRWEDLMLESTEQMIHGRGIWMVRTLCDSLEYNEKGNRATIVKNMESSKLVQIKLDNSLVD